MNVFACHAGLLLCYTGIRTVGRRGRVLIDGYFVLESVFIDGRCMHLNARSAEQSVWPWLQLSVCRLIRRSRTVQSHYAWWSVYVYCLDFPLYRFFCRVYCNHTYIKFSLWWAACQFSLPWEQVSAKCGVKKSGVILWRMNPKRSTTETRALSFSAGNLTIPNWIWTHMWIGRLLYCTCISRAGQKYFKYPVV